MRIRRKYISSLLLTAYFSSMVFNPVFAQNSDVKLRSSVDKTVPAIDLKGGVLIDKNNRSVNLSLRNSDLRQVLRMLADKAGQNIILDDSVKGNVTLDLNRTTVNKAFEYLMTINELTYWQDGNTIVVATKEKAGTLGMNMLKIKPIKIKYIDAGVVAKFLNTNVFSLNRPGSSSTPNTIVNPKTNEILIFGNENDIALAQKFIDYVDVKPSVKTFNVNYMSVKNMGTLICDTVFKAQGASSGGSSSGSSSSSSSSTSSGTSGSSGTVEEANIICATNISEKAGNLDSLDVSPFRVIMDPNTNQLTIYGGTQEEISQVDDLIKKFDKKPPQVYIEVSIIELNNSGSKTLSNTWTYQNGKLNYAFTGGDSGNSLSYPLSGSNPHYTKTLSDTISMLLRENKGRMLANPRIIAVNNRAATVNISSEYVKTRKQDTQQTSSSSGDSAAAVVSTTYEIGDAGIQLNLTPKVSPNGYVTMDITPTFSSIKEQVTAPSVNDPSKQDLVATLLNKRDLNLSGIRVKDGQTLVIGGLIQENENKSTNKMPLIADIPVIGALFKQISNEKSRSELILMITPKILKEDEDNSI